jgi:hypothetical protein
MHARQRSLTGDEDTDPDGPFEEDLEGNGGADNLRRVRDIAHHAHFISHHVVLRRCNVAHHVATRCITLRQVWQGSWNATAEPTAA